MSIPVYVASAGIISAMGNNIRETLQAFENHTSGIAHAAYLATKHGNSFPLGEVKLNNEQLSLQNKLDHRLSRTILLSYHAAKEALAPFIDTVFSGYRLGFISASTVGGMDKTENFFESFLDDPHTGDLHQVVHHDCGSITDYVAGKLGITGFVTTLSTACSSSANAIMLAARMIRAGELDIVIAGGVDALTRFTLNGFNSLMILDKEQCSPLDKNRRGLNLGEGAAYLVLMNEKTREKLNCETWCKVSGYCNVSDAYHQTALSDEGNGPYAAMAGALKMSGLKPSQIDYINMHGTGTANNDSAETRAVARLFQPDYPKLSATKSFTGHTLGASGAIEAVFSALALKQGLIYPNFSFNEPVTGSGIIPELLFLKNQPLTHVLSNSFGFGGNCTSLLFSKN